MRRSFFLQKYKLARLLGQEIWGGLLLKYSTPYTKHYKKRFRSVCNFIILEYERRVLFDFRRQFKSVVHPSVSRNWERGLLLKKAWGAYLSKQSRDWVSGVYSKEKKGVRFPRAPLFSRNVWLGYCSILVFLFRIWRKRHTGLIFKRRVPQRRRVVKKSRVGSTDTRIIKRLLLSASRKRFKRQVRRFSTDASALKKRVWAPKNTFDRKVRLPYKPIPGPRRAAIMEYLKPRKKKHAFARSRSFVHVRTLLFAWLRRFLLRRFSSRLGSEVLSNRVVYRSRLLSRFFKNFGTSQVPVLSVRRVALIVQSYGFSPVGFAPSHLLLTSLMQNSFVSTIGVFSTLLSNRSLFLVPFGHSAENNCFLLLLNAVSFFKTLRPFAVNTRRVLYAACMHRDIFRNHRYFSQLSWVRYKLKNRKAVFLELNYSTKKIRFGDYEDGFRIPAVRSSHKVRSKKQFRLLSFYRLQSFYGITSMREFKIAHSLFFKNSGLRSFIYFLECRFIFLLQLSNLFPSIYFVDQLIRHGNLTFCNMPVSSPHAVLSIGQTLSVPVSYYWRAINTLVFRLAHGRLLLNIPSFLEFNYVLLSMSLIQHPSKEQRTLPFSTTHSQFDPNSLLREIV